MQTQFFEIYRAGLKSAADMMTATLESARRLQQQLDALQSAIDDQTKCVRELAEVHSIDELMSLQTRLAGTQVERSVDFWSRVWRAAGDNQLAIMGQAHFQLGEVREGLRQLAAQAEHSEQRAA